MRHKIYVCLETSFERECRGPDRCTKLEQMVRATEKDFSPKCRFSAHRQGAKQRGRDEVNEAGYRNSTEGFENKVSIFTIL